VLLATFRSIRLQLAPLDIGLHVTSEMRRTKACWVALQTADRSGRIIFVANAHRDDGKGFVVHPDEKLTAFIDIEAAIRAVAYHLSSASAFKTLQATTAKLVLPPPQPMKSWPPSAMAYSVSSSPSCECFRTVARTAWYLCMLSTYTSVRREFPHSHSALRESAHNWRGRLTAPPPPGVASSQRLGNR
jgi:hypothetical protein